MHIGTRLLACAVISRWQGLWWPAGCAPDGDAHRKLVPARNVGSMCCMHEGAVCGECAQPPLDTVTLVHAATHDHTIFISQRAGHDLSSDVQDVTHVQYET